jgi:hypothetical protein
VAPQCPAGTLRVPDRIHCCWPKQAWSASRQVCVGIPQCPQGFEVEGEGCVSLDKDNDGIPNAKDACPEQAEDANGFEDDDGCPDEPKRLAVVAAQAEKQRQEAAAEEQHRQAEAKAEQQRLQAEEERKRKEAEAIAKAKQQADEAERERQEAIERVEAARQHKIQAARKRRTWGYVLGGTGVGVAVVGGVVGFLGTQQYASIKNGGGLATASDIQSAASTGTSETTFGLVADAVGAGLVVTGVVLWLTGGNPDTQSVGVTATGNRVSLTFRLP